AQGQGQAHGRGNRFGPQREPVPLRDVSADTRGRASRGLGDRGPGTSATGTDRRPFLRASGQAAGALTIAFYVGPLPLAAQEGPAAAPNPLPAPNAFLRIAPAATA